MATESSNVMVAARFRPMSSSERTQGSRFCISTVTPTSVVINGGADRSFTFDRVFGTTSQQSDIYNVVGRPLLDAVLAGYNACLLAYGQTGSGKTYTMLGPDSLLEALSSGPVDAEEAAEMEASAGVIPRIVKDLFDSIAAADSSCVFTLEASCVEIYTERVRDLLDPSPQRANLMISEGADGQPCLKDVCVLPIASAGELLDLMRMSNDARIIASTAMNERSSRSHSIFILRLTQDDSRTGTRSVSVLHLCDLAGSEQVSKTGVSGQQLKEAGDINKSLSTLGNVINALTTPGRSHIPYRDSKLTRLLQNTLGGNAKTALLIACSPSEYNLLETVSTLRFGARAKAIKQNAIVNVERSPEELKRYCETLETHLTGAHAVLQAVVNNARAGVLLGAVRPGAGAGARDALTSLVAAAETALRSSPKNSSLLAASEAMARISAALTSPQSREVGGAAVQQKAAPAAAPSVGGGVGSSSARSGQLATAAVATKLPVEDDDEGSLDEGSIDDSSSDSSMGVDETLDEVKASRDALQEQQASMVGLLSEASREMRALKVAAEAREATIVSLTAKVEEATAKGEGKGGDAENPDSLRAHIAQLQARVDELVADCADRDTAILTYQRREGTMHGAGSGQGGGGGSGTSALDSHRSSAGAHLHVPLRGGQSSDNKGAEATPTPAAPTGFFGLLRRFASPLRSPRSRGHHHAAASAASDSSEAGAPVGATSGAPVGGNGISSGMRAAAPNSSALHAHFVAFFSACERGNIDEVRAALAADPAAGSVHHGVRLIEAKDRSGRTALLYAARGGSLAVVEALAAAGADLIACDKDARSALAYASRRAHVEVASWLLANGLPAAQCDVHGLTPLHQAVLAKSPSTAELLLGAGADVLAKDSNGLTPLRLAKRFLTDSSHESRAVQLCLEQWLAATPGGAAAGGGGAQDSQGGESAQEEAPEVALSPQGERVVM